MRTTTLRSVVAGICALRGQNPANLSQDLLANMVELLNQRVKEAWEYEFWPELTPIEQRAYLPPWDQAVAYAAGTQIFNPTDCGYYQANQAPNTPLAGDQPSSVSVTWTAIDVPKIIALDQPNQTAIGEVRRITRQDPRVNPRFPGLLSFVINAQGIQVAPLAGPQVWAEFRLRPSAFGSALWNAAAANGVGDFAYRPATTGECYRCIAAVASPQATAPEALPAKWLKVDFPDRLANFVKRAVYADLLRASGQQDKAAAEEGAAYLHLSQASDIALASQGQYDRASAQVAC